MTIREEKWRQAWECAGTSEQVTSAYQSMIAGTRTAKGDTGSATAYVQGYQQPGETLADAAKRLRTNTLRKLFEDQAKHFVSLGRTNDAIAVYREALTRKDGERHLDSLSNLLMEAKRPEEAIKLYREAIAKDPKNIKFRESLAALYGKTGKPAERIVELNEVVALYQEHMKQEPVKSYINRQVADIYLQLGKKEEARKLYREWIKASRSVMSLNSFAMDYAANMDPKDRDGEIAVEAATRACELTGYGESMYLDTLATAYAEKGDFDAAVKWQLKAIELCDREGERSDLEDNLKLFRAKKTVPPHRPTPEVAPPPRVSK